MNTDHNSIDMNTLAETLAAQAEAARAAADALRMAATVTGTAAPVVTPDADAPAPVAPVPDPVPDTPDPVGGLTVVPSVVKGDQSRTEQPVGPVDADPVPDAPAPDPDPVPDPAPLDVEPSTVGPTTYQSTATPEALAALRDQHAPGAAVLDTDGTEIVPAPVPDPVVKPGASRRSPMTTEQQVRALVAWAIDRNAPFTRGDAVAGMAGTLAKTAVYEVIPVAVDRGFINDLTPGKARGKQYRAA